MPEKIKRRRKVRAELSAHPLSRIFGLQSGSSLIFDKTDTHAISTLIHGPPVTPFFLISVENHDTCDCLSISDASDTSVTDSEDSQGQSISR